MLDNSLVNDLKELKLHSANKNAAEFIEVIKDKICDWISYHNVYVPSRDKIQVLSVTFEEDEPSVALALLIDKDSKFDGYKFSIHLNDYRGRGVHVDVFNLRNSKVTNNWDGMTYLGFDKKGYSYELTQKEHDYFELVRNAKLDDFLGKAGNEIDNSLKTGLSGLGNLGR